MYNIIAFIIVSLLVFALVVWKLKLKWYEALALFVATVVVIGVMTAALGQLLI